MVNRTTRAFRESYNLLSLTGAAMLGTMLQNPLPLFLGAVLEAAYLALVPRSAWYQQRLSCRAMAAIKKRRQALKRQVWPRVRPALKQRIERLETMRAGIDAQISEDYSRRFAEVQEKLDSLMETFLNFAAREAQFHNYLESVQAQLRVSRWSSGTGRAITPSLPQGWHQLDARGRGLASTLPLAPPQLVTSNSPLTPPLSITKTRRESDDLWIEQTVREVQADYSREIMEIERLRLKETNLNTCIVLDRRVEVLRRRREFAGEIGSTLANLNHQLYLLEDFFGLIADELHTHSPEEVLADIETVIFQTGVMTQTLDEVAPSEAMLQLSA